MRTLHAQPLGSRNTTGVIVLADISFVWSDDICKRLAVYYSDCTAFCVAKRSPNTPSMARSAKTVTHTTPWLLSKLYQLLALGMA